jgi:hypothetical protein
MGSSETLRKWHEMRAALLTIADINKKPPRTFWRLLLSVGYSG